MTVLLSLACVLMAGLLLVRLFHVRAKAYDLKRLKRLLITQPEDTQSQANATSFLPDIIATRLVRAGWEPDRRTIFAILGFMAWVIISVLVVGGFLAACLSALILILLGFSFLEWRANRNMRALSDSMLGFMERVRQLLAVGNSLAIALERGVQNSPPVVAQCLMPTIRRIANGSGVADSLARTAHDLDLYELHLLATAARTNLRFGGSITATLKNIIENIRHRASVERELRSNTTQVRASAWVLAALPMLVAALVTLTNREYSRWFLTTDTGHMMIAYAIISQLLGVMAMKLIIQTRY